MERAPDSSAAPPGAGVRSLMQGRTESASKPLIPRWYLFAGDALLTALALVTIYKSPHPLSLRREIFCVATVLLAALLAVVAVLMPETAASPFSSAGAGVTTDGESPKQFGKQKTYGSGPEQ
jgi:hypothetical protein